MSNDASSETAHPYHRNVRLQNFTVFRDASFEFVPGINVLIGTNGSGKTHLLKALYAIQICMFLDDDVSGRIAFEGVFQTDLQSLARLPILKLEDGVNLTGEWADAAPEWHSGWLYQIPYVFFAENLSQIKTRPVFIPSVDMMAHTRRFLATYEQYKIDFDQTYRDVVLLLLSPEQRENKNESNLLSILSQALGGEVEEENERFYLRTPQGRFAMPLVAEGLRKIATLYQLLKNGFLKPGDVLFWDEPEVNLNPSLMGELIGVLLALARTGVQIFLATHSYVILKELDLQSTTADKVRYFALEPTNDGTVVHATDDYLQIEPNAIADQYDSMYDRQITRSISGGKPR